MVFAVTLTVCTQQLRLFFCLNHKSNQQLFLIQILLFAVYEKDEDEVSRAFDNFNLRERIKKSGKKWLNDIFFDKKSMGGAEQFPANQRKVLAWLSEQVEDYFEEHFGYTEETYRVFHISSP